MRKDELYEEAVSRMRKQYGEFDGCYDELEAHKKELSEALHTIALLQGQQEYFFKLRGTLRAQSKRIMLLEKERNIAAIRSDRRRLDKEAPKPPPLEVAVKVTVEGSVGIITEAKLDKIIWLLNNIITKEGKIMATLDELVTATEEQTTVVESLSTFVQGLKDQIAAIPGLSADQQTKIDAVFAKVTDNSQRVADAMVQNTPNE